LEDLNSYDIKKYVDKLKKDKQNFSKIDYYKCLKLCGITDTNNNIIYPTLAGTMIFGEYPQSFYPQLFVACAVIPGTDIGDVGELGERFTDNKRVEGTIEEMLDGTMNFLQRNMKTSVIINSDGKRTDRTEYPLEALREAVANALIHRDYSTQTENAYISVYMYNDRIEILNPGTLYGTNKLEKLGTATVMEARNPNIVRILEEKGSVIENRHSGIPTMKREMKNYNLPEPEFYEERGSFKVVFRNCKIRLNQLINEQVSEQVSEQVDEQVSEQVSEQAGKQVSEQVSEQVGEQVSEQVSEQVGKQVGEQVSEQAGKQVSEQVSEQVGEQVSEQVGEQVSEQVGEQISEQVSEQVGEQVSGQVNVKVSEQVLNYRKLVLEFCKLPKTSKEIRKYLNIKSRNYVSTNIIKPLINEEKLDYTNKNNINASNQKYITIIKNK
jgi:predicted HTH transcriptional regulator